jgi:hypothetical protein
MITESHAVYQSDSGRPALGLEIARFGPRPPDARSGTLGEGSWAMALGSSVAKSLMARTVVAGLTIDRPAEAAVGPLILEGSDSQTDHGLDPHSTNFLNGMATFSSAPTLATMLASYSGIYIAHNPALAGYNVVISNGGGLAGLAAVRRRR